MKSERKNRLENLYLNVTEIRKIGEIEKMNEKY